VERTASQSARFMRMTSWSRVIPALLTRISIFANWRWAVFDSGLDLVFVRYVDNEGGRLGSGGGDGGDEFVELSRVAGGGGGCRAFAGRGPGRRVADALGRSGDAAANAACTSLNGAPLRNRKWRLAGSNLGNDLWNVGL